MKIKTYSKFAKWKKIVVEKYMIIIISIVLGSVNWQYFWIVTANLTTKIFLMKDGVDVDL